MSSSLYCSLPKGSASAIKGSDIKIVLTKQGIPSSIILLHKYSNTSGILSNLTLK
jgi:hypothetical protein